MAFLEIRKLQIKDIIEYKDSVHELLKICFQITYDEKVFDEVIDGKYMSLINYMKSGKAYTFGAIKKDSLIGFLWGYPVVTPLEIVFHVAYICVLENGRGFGIGRQLIKEAENECKKLGLNHVELIVGANNISALGFYDHCGYKPVRYYLRKKVRQD